MSGTLYFAYGSNINLNQMAVRCPDAKVVEPAVLENYELLFRGHGSSFVCYGNLRRNVSKISTPMRHIHSSMISRKSPCAQNPENRYGLWLMS